MKYNNNRLCLDGVFFEDICSKYSTPTYIYSRDEILSNIGSYKINIDSGDLVCFSVKSSNNLHILKLISSEGLGFDVVSGGELKKVLLINADTNKIVFSGVGKTRQDLICAIKNNIKSINLSIDNNFILDKDNNRLHIDRFLGLIENHPSSIIDFINDQTLLIFDELEECKKFTKNLEELYLKLLNN